MRQLIRYVVMALLALGMSSFAFADTETRADTCLSFDSEAACQKLSAGKCAWNKEIQSCESSVKAQHHHHCYQHCHISCEQDHHCFWSHYEEACYPR